MLAGVNVVELAQWVMVPTSGAVLADWGADVVKVEHPVTGDAYRGLMRSGPAMHLANRGKRSIALDVGGDDGRDVLLELVARADVFLTNFLPGALARLRVTPDDLRRVNPRLIYARGHGYGTRGPDADKPAFDGGAYWARGGVAATLTPAGADFPVEMRGAFGDRPTAFHLAFGVAAALFARERTGHAATVDVSLLASAMVTMGTDILATLNGTFRPAQPTVEGRHELHNPLVATYRTADDRFLGLMMVQPDRYWARLCHAVDRPELAVEERFADIESRARHSAECVRTLDAIFATRTLAEWRRVLDDADFPWEPFQTLEELLADPQVTANGYIGVVESDDGTTMRLPTGSVQFDEQPPALRPAPEHGQHTEDVLLGLGYSWERIASLKDAGVIG